MSNEIIQNSDDKVFRELRLKFPNFSYCENGSKFPIATVPLVLYREISQSLGINDETKVTSDGRDYYMKKLDPDSAATGFNAAIGIRKDMYDVLTFVLWEYPPDSNEDSYLTRPILETSGGPHNTGGKSGSIREDLWMHLDQYVGFSLTSRSAKLISLTLFRAHQLATDPNCVSKKYWREDFFSSFRPTSNK